MATRAGGSLLAFALRERRFLGFGFSLLFFCSFGQTYLVSLFGAELRADFGLTHGGFGTVYGIATLLSGLVLVWIGRIIDRTSLRRFAVASCLGLGAACVFMGVAHGAVMLAVAFFALRLTGQGLLPHTAMTSMARYYDAARGKAVALALLGIQVAQSVLPAIVVFCTALLGWRATWIASAALVVLVLVPLVLWLLKDHESRHARYLAKLSESGGDGGARNESKRQWSWQEVIRDPSFYLFLPAVTAPAMILTGLLFHQVHLAEEKGWSLGWLASCFVGYSLAQLASSLGAGILVDRFGSRALLRIVLLPLAGACAVVLGADHWLSALPYMLLAGAAAGGMGAVGSSLWAEVYGVLHLGAIRSLTSAIMVVTTGLAPIVFGVLIDGGVSMSAISGGCAVYIMGAVGLTALARRGGALAAGA